MKAPRFLATAFAITAVTASLFAQVSPKPPLTTGALITIEGKITKVEWTNPRVHLYLDVMNRDSDRVESWVIETGPISELNSRGIKLSSLKVGVVVRATGKLVGNNRLEVPASGITFP